MALDYYIHGGLTKTGSTSIQQFLAANLDALAAEGVFYPVGYLDIHNRQHSPLSAALADGRMEEAARFARDVRARVATVDGAPGVEVDVDATVPPLGVWGPGVRLHVSGHAIAERAP